MVTNSEEILDFADTFEDFLEQIVPVQSANINSRSQASSEASYSGVDSPVGVPRQTRSLSSSSSDSSISMFGHSSFRPTVPPVRPVATSVRSPLEARHNTHPARPQARSSPTVSASPQTPTGTIDKVSQRVRPLNTMAPAPLRIRRTLRQETVRQHTITLTAEYLHFNNHPLSFQDLLPDQNGYDVASPSFDALLKHKDKLNALELALSSGSSRGWIGIPGWKVHQAGVTLQPEALGIQTV